MRLITYTNPVSGRDFLQDLRFSALASIFFKRVYPESEVLLATSGQLPSGFSKLFSRVEMPVGNAPLAFARAVFLKNYAKSSLFDRDTVFTGHDVIFLNKIPFPSEFELVCNYRVHPSQPYCSDLIFARVNGRSTVSEFFHEAATRHSWMPRPIVDGPADQLSWALTFGVPGYSSFNGKPFVAPKWPSALMLPCDPFFFTPNDAFPSVYSEFTGKNTAGQFDESDFSRIWFEKYSLHFKGPRKAELFKFAKWAHLNGLVDLSPLWEIYDQEDFFLA
jgi:hypothetical protein